MEIKRFFVIVLALSAIIAAFPVSGYAADKADDWTIYFRPAVRFGTDDRTLYIMDFLIPLYQDEKNVLFFNPKFTPNDQDSWETNLGIGYRRLLFDDKLVLGANVFYDTRRTSWDTYWDQVGFGGEAMTELNRYAAFTGRFNYYIPLTDPIVYGGGLGGGGGYIFRDLGIYTLGGGGMVEEAPEGFDAEIGYRIPFISDYVETWIYVGGYHYKGEYVDDVDGWSARLEVIPTDFIRVGYEYREDRTNKGEHHGEVALEIPFSFGNLFTGKNPFEGFGRRLSGSRDLSDRMVEPVRRDVDIVVVTEEMAGAGGAAGLLVEDVVFVNETATPGDPANDGSFEHPYATIDEAMADLRVTGGGCTTIHVINDDPGAGAAGGGTVNLAAMMIWGSAAPHPTFGFISNQLQGYPTIDSSLILNGDDDNALGMSLVAGTGIESNANTLIHNNVFMNNVIGVDVPAGSPAIYGNSFSGIASYGVAAGGGSPTISNNAFAGGLTDIFFFSGAGGTVSGNVLGGSASGIFSAAGFTGTVTVTGNTFNGNSIGLRSSNGAFTVTGNTFTNNDTGLEFVDGTLTATGNTLTCDTIGFLMEMNGHSLIGSNRITITGNGDAGGIYFVNTDVDATITDNVIAILNADGLAGGIAFDTCGTIDAEITGNVMNIANAGDYSGGIAAFDGVGAVDVEVSGNTVRIGDPGGDAGGIVFDTTGGTITADIGGNTVTISDALGAAVGIGLSSPDDIMAHIDGNDLRGGMSGSGISVSGLFSNAVAGIGIESSGTITGISTGGPGLLSLVSNNLLGGVGIAATDPGAAAYGIYLMADGDIGGSGLANHALISGNSGITVNTAGDMAAGIYFSSNGGDVYANVTGNNGMSVGSAGGLAAGIYLETTSLNIFGRITDNDGMTVTGLGEYAEGICLVSNTYIGWDGTPGSYDKFLISGNDNMTVRAPNGSSGGIMLIAEETILADISANTGMDIAGLGNRRIPMTGMHGLFGIAVISANGGLGRADMGAGLLVSGNSMTVNSTNNGFGIFAFAGGVEGIITETSVGGGILNNTMTVRTTDAGAGGIFFDSMSGISADIASSIIDVASVNGSTGGIIGYMDDSAYFAISGGSIRANGLGSMGIYLDSNGPLLVADISVPTIYVAATGDVGLGYYGSGIDLYTDTGDIDLTVSGITRLSVDSTNALSNGSNAFGIWADAGGDLLADISDISLIDVDADSDALGIELYSDAGDIYADISDFGITVDSTYSTAIGIDAEADGWINAVINGGSAGYINVDGLSGSGILLESYGANGSGIGLFADISVPTITAVGADWGAIGIGFSTPASDSDVSITGTGITVTAAPGSGGGVYGIEGFAGRYLSATIDGGTTGYITANGDGGAIGISLVSMGTHPTTGLGLSADITVPGIDVRSTTDYAYGIELATMGMGADLAAVIHDIPRMTVTSGDSPAYGVWGMSFMGDITGSIYSIGTAATPMTVGGFGDSGSFEYPAGIYLNAANDLGTLTDRYSIYDNFMNITNGTGEAYGILINYDTVVKGFPSSSVYAEIYNNTLSVSGIDDAVGFFDYGVIGILVAADNLIGYNDALGTPMPTVVSDNHLTLGSNVACLALYFNSIASGAVGTPGIGNYVDLSDYGVNTMIYGPAGPADPNSLGYLGIYTNFPWGYPAPAGSGTLGSGFDFVQP